MQGILNGCSFCPGLCLIARQPLSGLPECCGRGGLPSQRAQDNDQVPGLLRFKDSSHFLIIAQSVVLEHLLGNSSSKGREHRAESCNAIRTSCARFSLLPQLLLWSCIYRQILLLGVGKKSDGCLLHLFELIVFSINWASCHGLSVFIQNVLMNLFHSFNFQEKERSHSLIFWTQIWIFFFFCLLYIVPLETCWIVLSFWHWFIRMNFLWECGCRETILLSAQIISIILMFPSLGPYWMPTKTAVTMVCSPLGLHNILNLNDCSLLWS